MIIKGRKEYSEEEVERYWGNPDINSELIKQQVKEEVKQDVCEEIKKHMKVTESGIEGFMSTPRKEFNTELVILQREVFEEILSNLSTIANSVPITDGGGLLALVYKTKDLLLYK